MVMKNGFMRIKKKKTKNILKVTTLEHPVRIELVTPEISLRTRLIIALGQERLTYIYLKEE